MNKKWIAITLLAISIVLPVAAQDKSAKSSDLLISVVIPNLDRSLASIENIGAQVAPEKVAPGMMKSMLGGMLNDPNFENLRSDQPIMAFVGPTSASTGQPEVVIAIPAKAAEPYATSLANLNMQSSFDNGMLMAYMGEMDDARLNGYKAQYVAAARSAPKSDFRINMYFANMMQSFGPIIQMQMENLAQMQAQKEGSDGQASSSDFMSAYMQGVIYMLGEIDVSRIDIIMNEGLLALETRVEPRAGSHLAAMMHQPKAKPSKTLPLIEPSAVTGFMRFDSSALITYAQAVLDELAKQNPDTEVFQDEKLRQLVTSWSGMSAGDQAYAMSVSGDGIEILTITESDNPEAILGMIEQMGSTNFMTSMMKDEGIDMSSQLVRNTRTADGVAIHQFKTEMTMEDNSEAAEFASKMSPDMEIAIVGKHYIASSNPEKLDQTIARVKGGKTHSVDLKSAHMGGQPQHFAMDIDWVKLLKGALPALPDAESKKAEIDRVMSKIGTGAPILLAGRFDDGLTVRFHVPLKDIIAMGKEVQAIEKENKASATAEPESDQPDQ